MLQAGKVERVLVFGILVIIGLILVVAIRGARDVEREFENQVSNRVPESSTPIPEEPPLSTRLRNEVPPRQREQVNGAVDGWAPQGQGQRPKESRETPPAGERLTQLPSGSDRRTGDLNRPTNPGNPEPAKGPGNANSNPAGEDGPIVFRPPQGNAPSAVPPRASEPVSGPPGGGNAVEPVRPAPNDVKRVMTYVVQKGDTMEGIAVRLYGTRSAWTDILAANPKVSDPTKIRPDMELILPRAPDQDAGDLVKHTNTVDPGGASAPSNLAPRSQTTSTTPSPVSFRRLINADTHTVRSGDTLMNIAATAYGSKAAWRIIFESNADQLADKNEIRIGQVLKLPVSGP